MRNYMYSINNVSNDSTDDESTVSSSNSLHGVGEQVFCQDTYNQVTGQTQRRCFSRDKNRQKRQGHKQRQYVQVSTDDKAESTVPSKLLSVLLSVLFLFFLVYTLRLYYYNIEDLSEEDFEQRQKNISTMIQMMIGVIILIIGLYFIVSSKP